MASRRPPKRRPPDEVIPESPPSEVIMDEGEPLSPPKRLHQDVEENKTLDFFVVKRTLKRFCKKGAQDFLEADFHTWARKKDVDLEDAGYEFAKLRGNRTSANTKLLNQGRFQAAATQMATNANNVIIRDFAKRLRSFVMDVFQLNKREAYVILNGVFAETFRGADSEMVDPAVIEPIIIGLRDQIPRTPKNTIDWDARELLPISNQSLIQIERSNEESKDKEGYREQQRTFSLLPTKKGFEANHCKIDSARLDHSNPRSNREIDQVPRIRQLLRATPTKKTSNLTSLLNPIEFALEHPFSADSSFVDLLLKQVNWIALRRKAWHKSIIGFGNCGACGNSVSKKSPAGPVKVLASKLARYCEVVVVDEHRTSRVHHDCEASVDLKNQTVKRVCKDGVVRRVKVHRVLHCVALEGGCGKTVDRDANAAKSILSVLLCQLSGDPERYVTSLTQPRINHQTIVGSPNG